MMILDSGLLLFGPPCRVHHIRFRTGLRPGPLAASLQRSPRLHSCFKGPTFKGRGWEEKGKGKRRGKDRRNRLLYANYWIRLRMLANVFYTVYVYNLYESIFCCFTTSTYTTFA